MRPWDTSTDPTEGQEEDELKMLSPLLVGKLKQKQKRSTHLQRMLIYRTDSILSSFLTQTYSWQQQQISCGIIDMQNLEPNPDLVNQNLELDKIFGWITDSLG